MEVPPTFKYQDFWNEVVLPYFAGLANKKLAIALLDKNGIIRFATNCYANVMGYGENKAIQNKKLRDINIYHSIEIMDEIERIRQQVITKGSSISYVNFNEYAFGFGAYFVNHFPIYDPGGQISGSQVIIREFRLFNVVNYFQDVNSYDITKQGQVSQEVILSKRQHEILFLLELGFTQSEAAKILGIRRGTLATILKEQICPKFGVDGLFSKLLVKKARELGLYQVVPGGLINRSVIIVLDDDNL